MGADTMTTKERPVLFSAPMVRAILEGRKTQTRRVVREPMQSRDMVSCNPDSDGRYRFANDFRGEEAVDVEPAACPFGQPGDRLWVREAARLRFSADSEYTVEYRADETEVCVTGVSDDTLAAWIERARWREDVDERIPEDARDRITPWRPAMHVPRSCSRIDLEVTGVRVERLQEISAEDACAEGFRTTLREHDAVVDLRHQLRETWDALNAKRGFGWDANPWVWVVEFSRA